MSGFASDGAGKLIGPDGQPMDNESFLSDLTIYGVGTNTTTLVCKVVVTLTYLEL